MSNETPRKRRKVATHVDDIISKALASTGSEKTSALQIVIFLMKGSERASEAVAIHILQFASGILEDDSTVASWSMLLLAQ